MFVANFLILLIIGAKHVEEPFVLIGQCATVFYFAYFFIIVPLLSWMENKIYLA
jgi:ubiquinol-cytochrome c reductase cytochrome b subunit